jgi:hypothetical protein
MVAESMAAGGHPGALQAIAAIQKDQPVAALVSLARFHAVQGDHSTAFERIEEALLAYRTDPWPSETMMARALRLADVITAANPDARRRLFYLLREPFALDLLNQSRYALLLKIGFDSPDLCVAGLDLIEPHPPWQKEVLENRVGCYERTEHPMLPIARRELEEFLDAESAALFDPAGHEAPRGNTDRPARDGS